MKTSFSTSSNLHNFFCLDILLELALLLFALPLEIFLKCFPDTAMYLMPRKLIFIMVFQSVIVLLRNTTEVPIGVIIRKRMNEVKIRRRKTKVGLKLIAIELEWSLLHVRHY